MNKRYVLYILLLMLSGRCFAQTDSIFDQGVYRTFIVHTPSGYNTAIQYPIVVNLHGLNSNAAQEEAYSQFDPVADSDKFIVVYPNAINSSWTINGTSDVNFISDLIDTIRGKYSCNACLFITGISDGGFMTYKLACALPKPITAVAVVAGNMSQVLENTCVIANGLPVMHFHGTADPLVNYNGTFGIPPVDTLIQWWVMQNHCNPTPAFTALPNIDVADSCTVENYFYNGGVNQSVVTFYKIINGGHTWPGAVPTPPLGNTDEDISASALMGSFFKSYCSSTVGLNVLKEEENISVFPNPVEQLLTVELPGKEFNLSVYNYLGEEILIQQNSGGKTLIDCSGFAKGIYLLQIKSGRSSFTKQFVKS